MAQASVGGASRGRLSSQETYDDGSNIGSLWKQQLRRESSNTTQQVIKHMNPKLFLVQKQQAQMKAELAARRQYELQQEAQYAASCVPTVSVQVLTKSISKLSVGGSSSPVLRSTSNTAEQYPLLHSLATQGSLTSQGSLTAALLQQNVY